MVYSPNSCSCPHQQKQSRNSLPSLAAHQNMKQIEEPTSRTWNLEKNKMNSISSMFTFSKSLSKIGRAGDSMKSIFFSTPAFFYDWQAYFVTRLSDWDYDNRYIIYILYGKHSNFNCIFGIQKFQEHSH